MQRFTKYIIAKHGGGEFDQIPITATPDRKYDHGAASRYLRPARRDSDHDEQPRRRADLREPAGQS